MGDIQEVPLDITDVSEDIPDIQEDIPDTLPNIALEITEPEKAKAKAKGRPEGAPNKGPSKPRAKRTQIQEAPIEEPRAYEPSSPRRNLKIPTDPTSSEVAAAMLQMLQDQSFSRQNRKQRLYNSWFQ